MESLHLSSGRTLKQHSTYCMKCLELLDIINLWEVGVDGAARNFIRIRRELAYVVSGLQQLEELSDAHNKENPGKEERDLLAALKNSAEKAMEISHKAASACFQKTKPPDGDNTRGYSFTESSTKPISRIMNSSYSQGTGIAQVNDIPAHVRCSTSLSPKRPFSMVAIKDPPEDLHDSSSTEDIVENQLITVTEDNFKKTECKKSVCRKTDYTEWTPDDPPDHKPDGWHSSGDTKSEPYFTHIKSAHEIRNRRSKLCNSRSVDQQSENPSTENDQRQRSKSHIDVNHTERHRSSVSPTFSDDSDSDLQLERVMAKISSLEEERLNLMQTIEMLQSDNVSIRQSLRETLGTLEMKDIQLKLAMQDLGMATSEIKKASELNGKLRTLERERNVYVERLASLEDESSAVKLSLIQLLQDKAAVNKHLAMENSHLQKELTMKRSSAEGPILNQEASSSQKEEPADLGLTVHKQGFLVKRGGRVRTWKKRLFVLDSAGLSYYKTEQPIQNIPLNQILSATVSREVIPYVSHLFEIQTGSRTYLCGASTHEEMQSWVGILQTLTQYCGQHKIVGVCPGTGSDKEDEDQDT